MKGGDWEEYKSNFRVQAKATELAFDGTEEAIEEVAKDEAKKLSTEQKIMLRSTDCLRRIIAPGGAWSEDESVSSSDSRGDNVCNEALHVTGLYGPGTKVSLFLKDWELAKVALSCLMALDLLCQEMHEAW